MTADEALTIVAQELQKEDRDITMLLEHGFVPVEGRKGSECFEPDGSITIMIQLTPTKVTRH